MTYVSRFASLTVAIAAVFSTSASLAVVDKPVKLIVPAPAGGTMDAAARAIGDFLSQELKQSVLVENKPGAGGAIAVKHMLSQPADGQALVVTASNVLTEIPHVLKGGFDPLKDVVPISLMAQSTMVFIAAPQFPAKDVKEVVAYAKVHPRQVSYASYGPGSASQYAGAILNQKAGIDLQHVAFPGSAPALAQVMGGQIPLMFDSIVTSRPLANGGRVRMLAVADKSRLPDFPNVPTMAEAGYPEVNFSNWSGVIASSRMSPELAGKLHAVLQKIAANPAFKDRLVAAGLQPTAPRTLEQAASEVRQEHARNAEIVKTYGIKMD
ncbi:MAG: tripartite tricarboxylate transporter substrate binding protein [Burkholderiales bacterium]|nr:tripartite tricarboxylate transporter substrate binding protein [Burkholderiales bacterium]MBK8666833.1 tripartite tricarboxylate transporter substrate binding protein [Burkholderiales bacterium]